MSNPKTYLCQFCDRESNASQWKDDRCPLCGETYDWVLAMDEEDE